MYGRTVTGCSDANGSWRCGWRPLALPLSRCAKRCRIPLGPGVSHAPTRALGLSTHPPTSPCLRCKMSLNTTEFLRRSRCESKKSKPGRVVTLVGIAVCFRADLVHLPFPPPFEDLTGSVARRELESRSPSTIPRPALRASLAAYPGSPLWTAHGSVPQSPCSVRDRGAVLSRDARCQSLP